jgi:hypothetical protein
MQPGIRTQIFSGMKLDRVLRKERPEAPSAKTKRATGQINPSQGSSSPEKVSDQGPKLKTEGADYGPHTR